MALRAVITGVGHYLPEQVVTNHALEKLMDTSDEWIRERTGIRERRFFKEGKDTTASMGVEVSKMAMERAGVDKHEIDLILFATLSPDYSFPGSGVLVQRQLGLKPVPCLDIRQQCSGFVYGLSVADAYIKSGQFKKILLVCSEIQSNILELSTRGRNIAVIFGDGAGAVVLEAEGGTGRGILSTHLYAQGEFAEELMLEHPGSKRKERLTKEMIENGELLPYMNGPVVFKHAVKRFSEVIEEGLKYNNLNKQDLKLLIPHQANLRISEFLQKKMGLPGEKVYNNIQRYGNTTSASIPIALSEAWQEGRVQKNDLLCFAAFGSGFTWGSAFVRW